MTKQFQLITGTFLFGLPLLVMGFGPSIYRVIHLNKRYWFIPICLSMSVGLFCIELSDTYITKKNSFQIILLTVILPLLLLLVRYRDIKESYRVAKVLDPLKVGEFLKYIFQAIWLLVAEEVLFRAVFFQNFNSQHLINILILNSFIFIYYHYFNRYSSSIYQIKDYIFQGILAFILSFLYLQTQSILLCIIGHFIYNSIHFFSLILRSPIYKKMVKEGDNYE